MNDYRYPPLSPFSTGLSGRCPRCGEGRMFRGFLSTVPHCSVCGLDLAFADSGDGPAVFVMFLVGAIVVAGAFIVEFTFEPPYWLHAVLWVPLVMILALGLLRPAKGLMIALQYRNDAREGRLADRGR